MRAMRVLVIEQGGRGGVADYTEQLVAALAEAGLEVELATALDHRYGPLPGVRVVPVFPYLRGGSPLRDLARRLRLQRLTNAAGYYAAVLRLLGRARRADVVHVQGGHFPPLVALALATLAAAGARIVHTPHNTFQRGRPWTRSFALAGRFPVRVIVHAEADLAALDPAVRAKAVVVPHGEYGALASRAALPSRAEARAALGLPAEAAVALVFGQLRPDKGVGDVLRAAREVEGVHVVLAGEDLGALEPVADVLADPALSGRVTVLTGFQPADETARLFAAADVAVLAYRRASASGVLLLAYGFERPVVAYPAGGLVEAVAHGRTGWLAPSADPAALAGVLREVVAAGPEEALRRGREGKALAAERFAWPAIAERTRAVYEEAAASGRG